MERLVSHCADNRCEKPATWAGLSACSRRASRSLEKGTAPKQGDGWLRLAIFPGEWPQTSTTSPIPDITDLVARSSLAPR